MPARKTSTTRRRVRPGRYFAFLSLRCPLMLAQVVIHVKFEKLNASLSFMRTQLALTSSPAATVANGSDETADGAPRWLGRPTTQETADNRIIGRRRERFSNSDPNKNTESTYSSEGSQTSRPKENPASHVDGTTPPEQLGSNFAQTTSYELSDYVDMLGDLPFNIDFDLVLNPVDLHFNGEGLGFAPPSTLDHLFPPPTGGSGDSINPTNLTDRPLSPHFLTPSKLPIV